MNVCTYHDRVVFLVPKIALDGRHPTLGIEQLHITCMSHPVRVHFHTGPLTIMTGLIPDQGASQGCVPIQKDVTPKVSNLPPTRVKVQDLYTFALNRRSKGGIMITLRHQLVAFRILKWWFAAIVIVIYLSACVAFQGFGPRKSADFGFLKFWISYDEVVEKVGPPDRLAYGDSPVAQEYDVAGRIIRLNYSSDLHLESAFWLSADNQPADYLVSLPLASENMSRRLSFQQFSFLRKGISYYDVISNVGPADQNVGWGLYILQYNLQDGSCVRITFSDLGNLNSASLIGADGIVQEIIEP